MDYFATILLLRHLTPVAITHLCSTTVNVVIRVASRTKCFEIVVSAIGRDF